MTTPTALQCDSPKVLTRKSVPKLLDMNGTPLEKEKPVKRKKHYHVAFSLPQVALHLYQNVQ